MKAQHINKIQSVLTTTFYNYKNMQLNYFVIYIAEINAKFKTEYFTLLNISSFLTFWKYNSGKIWAQYANCTR